MAEYIEREALITKFKKMELGEHGLVERLFADGVYAVIAAFPAADVVPVVRCKDCKHKGWVQEPFHGKSVDYCKIWDCTLRNLEATFCSYGEQKDGGADNA